MEILGYLNILGMIRSPLRFKIFPTKEGNSVGTEEEKGDIPRFLSLQDEDFSSLPSLAPYQQM